MNKIPGRRCFGCSLNFSLPTPPPKHDKLVIAIYPVRTIVETISVRHIASLKIRLSYKFKIRTPPPFFFFSHWKSPKRKKSSNLYRSISPPPTHSPLIPTRLRLASRLQLSPLRPHPANPIRNLLLRRPSMMMMLFLQKALLHGMTNRLLLRNRCRKPLVQRLGRPRRQRGVHIRLFLPPRYLQRLMRQ